MLNGSIRTLMRAVVMAVLVVAALGTSSGQEMFSRGQNIAPVFEGWEENSLYPSMAQRATSAEVLRILISIGPTETMHFQTWSDKAGAAVSPPLAPLTDPTNGLTFPNLNSPPFGGETFTTNLIMPEPCVFLSRKLPRCSIIRPTKTGGVAMGALAFLTAMGLFIGQSAQFFELMRDLAAAADAARRWGD